MQSLRAPRFDPTHQADALRAHLDQHGFAVVSSAVEGAAAMDEFKALFWDFLESIPGTEVRRADPATWMNKKDWLPSPGNGIISGFGFNHCAFMWRLRLLPKVRRAFEVVWDDETDLLVSFDGGNCFRPWNNAALQQRLGDEIKEAWATISGWWHVDQNPMRPHKQGKQSVQGLVSLTAATESTGGLCVIPGSHKHHDAVCERSRIAVGGDTGGDFVPILEGDEALANGGALIVCEAGDLILWDSRLIHCNTPAIAAPPQPLPQQEPPGVVELLRIAGYVCMTPASKATEEVLEKRREAFCGGFGTSHWPHEFNCRVAPLPGMPENNPNEASPETRRLVGFDRGGHGGGGCGGGGGGGSSSSSSSAQRNEEEGRCVVS